MWPWKKKKLKETAKKRKQDLIYNLWHTWASVQCLEGGESPGEAASIFMDIMSQLGIDLAEDYEMDQEDLTLSAIELMRCE